MVRHLLRECTRPKAGGEDRKWGSKKSKSKKSSSSKKQQQRQKPTKEKQEEEDSASTYPIEAEPTPTSPVNGDAASRTSFGINRIIDMNQLDYVLAIDDEQSTLTNEEPSIHFVENEDDDDDEQENEQQPQQHGSHTKSVRSTGTKSHQSRRSSSTTQVKEKDYDYDVEDARQNSLLDMASSMAESSSHLSTTERRRRRHGKGEEVSSTTSSHHRRHHRYTKIRRQTSSQSSTSRRSWGNPRSRVSDILQKQDDESSWGAEEGAVSVRSGGVRQNSVGNPSGNGNAPAAVAQSGQSVTRENQSTRSNAAPPFTPINTAIYNTIPEYKNDDDDDDDDEADWSDPETTDTTSQADSAGQSWSVTSIIESPSATSSVSSTTSSIALVRQKWKARRRLVKRNVKFNVEEDWCVGNENEDWPGAAPQEMTVILEEEQEEDATTLESYKIAPKNSSVVQPKKSGIFGFFACYT